MLDNLDCTSCFVTKVVGLVLSGGEPVLIYVGSDLDLPALVWMLYGQSFEYELLKFNKDGSQSFAERNVQPLSLEVWYTALIEKQD